MPSIRGRGPHTVIVQPRKVERVKGAVVYVNDGPPVQVERCDVQHMGSDREDLTRGVQVEALRRVFARTWPGDENSLVYFDGDLFESVGLPDVLERSRRTSHVAATLRKIGPAAPPTLPKENP